MGLISSNFLDPMEHLDGKDETDDKKNQDAAIYLVTDKREGIEISNLCKFEKHFFQHIFTPARYRLTVLYIKKPIETCRV